MMKCFACDSEITEVPVVKNKELNLPVCINCRNTEFEKKKIEEFLESLADGLVCGCI